MATTLEEELGNSAANTKGAARRAQDRNRAVAFTEKPPKKEQKYPAGPLVLLSVAVVREPKRILGTQPHGAVSNRRFS
jgi:hypothetical protein